ncbi:MAG TPA: prolyl oligopeptidase family serine peptidase [Ktedonobacterales bacterium]|nr:prolyl oligopeptidase family serine peptidase [Ktedonobacterales bacterium]
MRRRIAARTATKCSSSARWPLAPALVERLIAAGLLVAGLVTVAYAGLAMYVATGQVYAPPLAITETPAKYGLAFAPVTFPARDDGVPLRGWFIPGVRPNGSLTARRVIIMVHGKWQNRTDPSVGLLDLSHQLVLRGFAVLAFDMRGMGQSPPAPLSRGYFEQRDVLGAVDFLRAGRLPYPHLGRPRGIAGWGVSLGAAALLLASAREPAISVVVADSSTADILPIIERDLSHGSRIRAFLVPGVVGAARALYGIDYAAVRPVDVVARIAPRPLLLIQGAADTYFPPASLTQLAAAARSAPHAQVQTWLVPGAEHGQAFHIAGVAYVEKVSAFLSAALGSA